MPLVPKKHRALASALSSLILGAASATLACNCTQLPPAGSFAGVDAGDEPSPPDAPMDASSDAAMRVDAVAAVDASYPFPLSKCNVGHDIYYLDVTGPAGRIQLGESTHTDMGTNWFVELQPELNVMLATPTGPVGTIQVWTPDSTPAVPGTYPQGSSNKGTSINLLVLDEGCSVTAGTLTVVDLQYDWPDGSPNGDVTSLLLSFDPTCTGQTLRGCIRYSR